MSATVAGRRATLRGAIQVLQQVGWTQQIPTDPHGRVCAQRAIVIAADGDAFAARDALVETENLLRPLNVDLVQWNDQDGRQLDHVLSLLRTVVDRVAA